MQNQTLKEQLAISIRMMEQANHIDFNGHMSTRVPETDFILINSAGASRSTLTADDVIMIDLQGNVIEGDGRPPNEFPLHTQIYKRRKDIQAIAHTHPRWSTMFTIAKIPLRPVVIQGAVLGDISVFPKSQSISEQEIANDLAEKLAGHHIILLKSHGAVITGTTIVETFVRSVFLEENAYRQYMASQLGYAHSLEDEDIQLTKNVIWQPNNIKKIWDYHYSKL
ncbi:class II aldolase/adducin family protein [Peribacillus sp. TH27]|uniref:class II aldolase/adducin family protein n=1 Tax=Peribacillus sp. TH27 TaxID=2798484 RepID=UPI001912F70A|nr:class II aldolase/adducin family protein [Peribacillus sp. TH27]MBK5458142.1 class II aldolase/adducin family protein [Peribacillus sp. TH27]